MEKSRHIPRIVCVFHNLSKKSTAGRFGRADFYLQPKFTGYHQEHCSYQTNHHHQHQ